MKTKIAIAAALFAAGAASGAVEVRQTPEGGVSFPGGEIFITAFRAGWRGCDVKADWSDPFAAVRKFRVIGDENKTIFDGRGRWTLEPDGSLKGVLALTCAGPCDMQCVGLRATIPHLPPFGVGWGEAKEFDIPVEGGGTLRLSFGEPVKYTAQDSRKWGGAWTARFGAWLGERKYDAGEKISWTVRVSSPDGIDFHPTAPCVISEGDGWVRIEGGRDAAPGSALDFTDLVPRDAPAGKHGWLKSVGGRFEFENLPGVEQRFYGVNLCFSANYLEHDVADALVDRLVKAGYNSIRVHHHDEEWMKSEKNREKLDYLIARAIERGIYITTDLYVSRIVKWRDIGVDKDGDVDRQVYKTLVGIHQPAFDFWARFAKDFLEHVNPYTGRAYKDEPGMPLVSLVNEGGYTMGWNAKSRDPFIAEAWREFGGEGPVPNPWVAATKEQAQKFDDWLGEKVWTKCASFVRGLGARALLTNDNNGERHGDGEGIVRLYDYCDNHFYVDHPSFVGPRKWRLPSKCANSNPIKARVPALMRKGYAKGASRPYTITEWNFSGPGRYRAVGGIYTGAAAAEQEWDGLWRFAYSHNADGVAGKGGGPGYFDLATDPLSAASDRACVMLYLRRDAGPGTLAADEERGSMSITSPLTCGGFAEEGEIAAGPLRFSPAPRAGDGKVVPATVWASSLDGKPLASSSRILLVHLTDVQGDGTTYFDDTRRITTAWGNAPLIEAGDAEVSFAADAPGEIVVHALDAAGNRTGEVAAETKDGRLAFRVSTKSPTGGRMFYELTRK